MEEEKTMKKGIKLDFKKTNILPESMKMVQSLLHKVNFPLWINADIIQGPRSLDSPKKEAVDAKEFLRLCEQYAPKATISPGKAH